MGPHLSFGSSIQSVSLEAARGTGYLSQVPCYGPSFVLWKQETGLRLEAMRGLRPHLSFGNGIASEGREGHGASFALWKQETGLRLEATRGHGPDLSIGTSIRPDAREGIMAPANPGFCGHDSWLRS